MPWKRLLIGCIAGYFAWYPADDLAGDGPLICHIIIWLVIAVILSVLANALANLLKVDLDGKAQGQAPSSKR